ncbi:mammalian cell entry protein [Mycobacterium sp. 5-140-3-2]|uniref:mammalian cell entry protein n=1 Tax=unclassified Mycobacterium TaxID=2642494 RepID=UPI002D7A05F5|nr:MULTISPECIES: mammalian cell entry protein [unclassified Mycobacterium]WRU84027.1 mammalian cell entry protein [Mycobacterium sp. 5-140-3-2]WSE39825.1 mammalian cell entry protein [Mycobacterium sp. 5-140-3-1]
MREAVDFHASPGGDIVDADGDTIESDIDPTENASTPRSAESVFHLRPTIRVGLTIVVALSVLVGWLGFRSYQTHQAQIQRNQFLQVARQGALNLTTIDWRHADTDVQRILDGATGQLHDDFAKRSKPFIEVVKQAKAITVGTISSAGLESETADTAQVLVAMTVQTSDAAASDQAPRAWRMRIFVQKTDGQVKVSNVEFVP